MDYETKILERFGSQEGLAKWLEKNHTNWRNEEPALVAEWILREAIGWHQYDELDAKTLEAAEEFIMENYIGA